MCFNTKRFIVTNLSVYSSDSWKMKQQGWVMVTWQFLWKISNKGHENFLTLPSTRLARFTNQNKTKNYSICWINNYPIKHLKHNKNNPFSLKWFCLKWFLTLAINIILWQLSYFLHHLFYWLTIHNVCVYCHFDTNICVEIICQAQPFNPVV